MYSERRENRNAYKERHLQRYYYPTFHALLSGSNAKEDETWTEPPFLFIVLLGHRHARSIIEGPCPILISTRQPRGSIMDKDKRNNIFYGRQTVGGCCIILPGNKHYKIDFFLLVTC